ncbi:MAG: TonB-dependent receptor, partial [Bryobacterales bacterium]|nr:TonB-dependent receptor [Bryobacterales bacterium]
MRTKLFAFTLLALALSLPVSGQTFGDISGAARDTTGASIPAAQITLVNIDTNATRSVASNEDGLFSFPALPPGTYTLKAEKTGFKTVTHPGILLQVQQSARVDVEMPVGQVSESVEVTATAALLTTENATVGTVVENKRIVELPLNGRNYLQLVSLSPNVSYGF